MELNYLLRTHLCCSDYTSYQLSFWIINNSICFTLSIYSFLKGTTHHTLLYVSLCKLLYKVASTTSSNTNKTLYTRSPSLLYNLQRYSMFNLSSQDRIRTCISLFWIRDLPICPPDYFKMPRDKPINLSFSERKLVFTYSIFLLVFIFVVRVGIEPTTSLSYRVPLAVISTWRVMCYHYTTWLNKSNSNCNIYVFHLSLYAHVFYLQFCFDPALTTSPGITFH